MNEVLRMRLHRDLNALRGFAVLGVLCALVVACRGGGIGTGGLVPAGPQTDSSFIKKRRPDVVRIVPFEKSPKLGVSAGQPVFALFSSKQLPLVSSTPDISVYGAPAVSGQAAPLVRSRRLPVRRAARISTSTQRAPRRAHGQEQQHLDAFVLST